MKRFVFESNMPGRMDTTEEARRFERKAALLSDSRSIGGVMRALILSLCAVVLLSGCMMPAKTTVTKDGFMARMKTTEKHRAIVDDYDVYRTDCRWDQQMKDKDGEYYCPPPATKEAYDSHVYLAQYMESVLDKWGPEVLKAGAMVGSASILMHGLQTQAVSPGVQQGGNSISTVVQCGAGKAFNGIGSAPGCK